VVVTGLGTLAPNGLSTETFWAALLKGESAVARIEAFDTTGYRVQIGAELRGFSPEAFGMDRKAARRNDLCTRYAVCVAKMAVADADLDLAAVDLARTGVIFGSGIGGIWTFEQQHSALVKGGPRKVSPFFIPAMIADMPAGEISIAVGARGPNYATVSACASGAHAIGNAYREISSGEADVMFTGGCEAAISPISVAGFASLRALSTRNDEPERASRPFDAERDGFVLGEGAACLILEEAAHARARGARVYGEILSAAFTGDAYHQTAMEPSGEGAASAMRRALELAGLQPEDVSYINAHGTSTEINDKTETRAIKAALGEHAHSVAVSSTKSMTGHLLGASGAVETVACLLAATHDRVPPTINYENPDPECDLDYIPNEARDLEVRVAMNNSFGFGGHNAVLIVGKERD